MSLSANDFPAFFEAVHGVAPFPWQTQLLLDVSASGAWPSVLDLPTGSGKTAALDVAVFHLALEADKGSERRAPVRIAFVVDRRIIVDDAFARAGRIESALADPKAPEIVARVAERLALLAERRKTPLLARRLRGGVPREDDWARTPAQPTILCSTVDQVGSRLLFRGYGVSDRMKPVHAGLLGSDCLVLLDEAHLSEPFRQTLEAVARHSQRRREAGFPAAPFSCALLTATPGEVSRAPFGLQDEDRFHPVLRNRLEASKPTFLIAIKGTSDEADDQRVDAIVAEVGKALAHLARQPLGAAPVIGVVVNRVLRARAIFSRLKTLYEARDDGPAPDISLIIGPAREADRDRPSSELEGIKTGRARDLDRPKIVVATQTIEAGADLDFDALISEIAPLDALKQRFGRLNRGGRRFTPFAAILAHREDERPGKNGDPVYGQKAAETWRALQALAGEGGSVQFGLSRLGDGPWIGDLSPEEQGALMASKPDAPVMMPAYVDLWSQTSPIPAADPAVSLFLHGPDRSTAMAQVVWRDDLDLDRPEADLRLLLSLTPPKAAEAVQLPLSAVRRWLVQPRAGRQVEATDFADAPEREPDPSRTQATRPALRWFGPEDNRTAVIPGTELRPDDLIVVPASYGGCDAFGWDPTSAATVRDVADKAAEPFWAKRFALRLTAERVSASEGKPGGVDDESVEIRRFKVALADVLAGLDEPRQGLKAESLVASLRSADGIPSTIRRALDLLADETPRAFFPYGHVDGHPRGLVLLAPHGVKVVDLREGEAGGSPATEDDDLGSADGSGISLEQHSIDVRDIAQRFACRAGLPAEVAADVALAAWLHDAGKADERFQTWLYGGSWLEVGDEVLAKSAGPLQNGSWDRAGLPPSWRHEALSVRLAREHARFAEAHDPELVLWLIGVHHGFGRPLFPDRAEAMPFAAQGVLEGLKAAAVPGPQSLAFDFEGADWPQMFDRLKTRYGVWELARLEAILRLADHRASEGRGGAA